MQHQTSASAVTITPRQPLCTLINVIEVDPKHFQALLSRLRLMTEEEVITAPGFVSATFHISEDHTHIVNYAQWRSQEDLHRMLAHNEEHVRSVEALAKHVNARVYQVVNTYVPEGQEGLSLG